MTRKELAETLKINTSAIQKHIQKLKQLGIIERVGSEERFASISLADGKNLAVLDIVTDKDVQIARNRVALREIGFRLIDHDRYHGLLAFYHSEDTAQPEYRLSFIKGCVFGRNTYKTVLFRTFRLVSMGFVRT